MRSTGPYDRVVTESWDASCKYGTPKEMLGMKRNVILVSIDSLRADHCSHWGYQRETTPTLDRMAEDGIVFENAVVPGPKTPESMPAIFTGEFPTANLQTSKLDSWRNQIHPHMRRRETIAEQFSRHGYTTAGFTPNSFTSEYFGFDAGFDHFEDFLGEDYRPGFEVPYFFRAFFKWVRREGTWKTWEKYYNRVAQFVRKAPEPYFLWVFLQDVHSPYLVPRQYRTKNSWPEMMYANWKRSSVLTNDAIRRRLVSAYDDSIRYADDFLRRLLNDSHETNPVMVVHSDHGEAFGEHGNQGHERFLFEENVHVPFVIGNVDGDCSVETPTSLRRLPRMLEPFCSSMETDYRSTLQTRIDTESPVIFRSNEGNRIGVRCRRFKLVVGEGESVLYDLESDPGESRDVSGSYPDVRDLLESVVEKHRTNNDEKAAINKKVDNLGDGASDAEQF